MAVLLVHGELRVLTARPLRAGEVVFELEGVLVERPTRFTVQVGLATHLECPSSVPWQEELERYPWRYLNHACAPNCRIGGPSGRELVAVEDIPAGAELSFDYESNELELAEPFRCRCGACGGRLVRGFAHLTDAEREERRAHLSEHLAPLLDARSSTRDAPR